MISISGIAHAQDTTPKSPPTSEAAQEAEPIVVTGSRIVRTGNDMPTPVTVINVDQLQTVQPTTLSEGLQTLPAFSGSRGQASNPSAAGGVGAGNGSAAQVNLRNLGAEKTLVLLDGRRVPPSSFTNFVDIDMIPQQLVERVEIVTGGVSAVYGSDAVAGAVNFILNKKFNGLKLHGQTGISQEGDDFRWNVGGAFGAEFADGRGHFEGSYEYRFDDGISRRSERDWFNYAGVVGNGTASAPYQLLTGLRNALTPFGGRVTCTTGCPYNGYYFATDGALVPFDNGTATTTNGVQVGGAGGYADNSLRSGLTSHQIFGRIDYEVSDGISAFAMASGNIKTNTFFGGGLGLANGTVFSSTNAFLAPQYQQGFLNAGKSTFTLRRGDIDYRDAYTSRTNNWMYVGGLEGSIGDYSWQLAYTRGESHLHTIGTVASNQLLAAALDAVVNPATNQIVCQASLTNTFYANCVPFNAFGPTATTQAMADYVTGDVDYQANNTLDDVLASVTGKPFSTWAGDVGVALTAEWRKSGFEAVSSGQPTDLVNCAGIRYNCNPANAYWQTTFASRTPISNSVWEVAAETEVPLLRDASFAKSLSISGAARYTSYETSGNYWTWKLGADWTINDSLRFRGTLSRDIRAPTLNDLFAATSVVPGNYLDYKTNLTYTVDGYNIGNTNLTAEIGHTWTIGGVFTPKFVPGLSLAVDYYHIRVENAIQTLQGFRDYLQKSCYDNNEFCSLQQRDPTSGLVTRYYILNYNIAEVETEGVDAELNYRGTLFGRPMSLRGLAAYQPHAIYRQPGVDTIDYAGVAFGTAGRTATPKWRLTGIASFMPVENFRTDILYTWRTSLKGYVDDGLAAIDNRIPPFGSMTINLAWQIPKSALPKSEFFLNVNNVFNAKPPPANSTGSGGAVGGFNGFVPTDDSVGRYFTFGVRIDL